MFAPGLTGVTYEQLPQKCIFTGSPNKTRRKLRFHFLLGQKVVSCNAFKGYKMFLGAITDKNSIY